MRFRSPRRVASIAVALAPTLGCGAGNIASQLKEPPAFEAKGQTKCKVSASQSKPLIVEWPSADRTDLEARSRQGGLVVVGYEGCEMRLLPRCHAPGAYAYIPVTTKEDTITIRDADELYANIPVGAAKLESKLSAAGQLNVSMTLVGKFSADRAEVRLDELEGACDGATHVVVGMSVGAFEFFAGADASVGAGVDVMGAGAGARSDSSRETLSRDGDTKACHAASVADEAPPAGCGASIRLEVEALAAAQQAAAAGGGNEGKIPELVCPAGTELVDGACQPKISTTCPDGMKFQSGQGCIPEVVQIPTVVRPMVGSPARGSVDAPVVIQWFGGYQDPFTVRVDPTIRELERAHPGKIRVVFRQAPLSFHKLGRPAAYATLEAFAQQGDVGFWKMHDALVGLGRGELDEARIEEIAQRIGLDMGQFHAAMKTEKHKAKVDQDFAEFNALGLSGTPSFLVGRDVVVGAQPLANFDAAVKRVLAGEDGKPANLPGNLRAKRADAAEVADLTIPPGAPTLGPPNAPVTIHWFASFQEPFTARVAPAVARLADEHPRDVRIVWRHFTLPFHQRARPAANLALLAQASGKFWPMEELLIANRGALEDDDLRRYGAQLGLDAAAVQRAIDERPLDATLDADIEAAKSAGVSGVPTMFVNGKKLVGAVPYEQLEQAVQEALKAAR